MKKKLLLSLTLGGLSYLATVLFNLILGVSLFLVLKRGVIAFFIFLIVGWSILFFIESFSNYSHGKENKEKETTFPNNESNMEQDNNENSNNEDFSPLNPPHLEVNEDE